MPGKSILLLLALMACESHASEDWIGLEEQRQLTLAADLEFGISGDWNSGLNLGVPIGNNGGIDGNYRISEFSHEQEDFQSLMLATGIWLQLSELVDIEVNYFFEGNIDELEKETLGMALGFNRGDWRLQLQYEAGDLQLFTRTDLGDLISSSVPQQVDSDVDAYTVRISWNRRHWYWQAIHQQFDYERDLSVLSRRQFAQFVVKPATLAQSSLLVSKYSVALIGYTNVADDFSLQLAQDQSAIDNLYSNTLIVNWQHWRSANLAYTVVTSFAESEDAELALGIRWLM